MQEVFPDNNIIISCGRRFCIYKVKLATDEPGSVEHVIDIHIKQEDGNLYEHFQEVRGQLSD